MEENLTIKETTYTKTRLSALKYMCKHNTTIDVSEYAKDHLKVSLSYQFYQKDAIPPVRYPKDWWEAFKERWFPKWLLERYPAQYNTVIVKECLMNVPTCATPYIKMYRLERR
jgi:hypothetical protein